MKPALDWSDRATCTAWLADLRHCCHDLGAVAEDQTAPIAKRKLGRAAAVQLLGEATSSLDELLAGVRGAGAGRRGWGGRRRRCRDGALR